MTAYSSRIPGFHKLSLAERLQTVARLADLDGETVAHLGGLGQVDPHLIDHLIEHT